MLYITTVTRRYVYITTGGIKIFSTYKIGTLLMTKNSFAKRATLHCYWYGILLKYLSSKISNYQWRQSPTIYMLSPLFAPSSQCNGSITKPPCPDIASKQWALPIKNTSHVVMSLYEHEMLIREVTGHEIGPQELDKENIQHTTA